jgi:hypothetical protein
MCCAWASASMKSWNLFPMPHAMLERCATGSMLSRGAGRNSSRICRIPRLLKRVFAAFCRNQDCKACRQRRCSSTTRGMACKWGGTVCMHTHTHTHTHTQCYPGRLTSTTQHAIQKGTFCPSGTSSSGSGRTSTCLPTRNLNSPRKVTFVLS